MRLTVANQNATLGNLHLARKQLDELDALVQRMLDLPEAQAGGAEEESNMTNQGLFNPIEAPWAPPTEKKEAISQKSATTVHYTTLETPNPQLAPAHAPEPSPDPLKNWKPSSLTWAPLAQAWEKKLTDAPLTSREPVSAPAPRENPAPVQTITKAQPQAIPTNPKLPPIQDRSPAPLISPTLSVRKKNPWMDVLGFLGIMLLVFASVLFLTGSFPWPWR